MVRCSSLCAYCLSWVDVSSHRSDEVSVRLFVSLSAFPNPNSVLWIEIRKKKKNAHFCRYANAFNIYLFNRVRWATFMLLYDINMRDSWNLMKWIRNFATRAANASIFCFFYLFLSEFFGEHEHTAFQRWWREKKWETNVERISVVSLQTTCW